MNLQDKSAELFKLVEPQLTAIARKYGVEDPAGEARSWYARFIDIIKSFDDGRYEKRMLDEEGKSVPLPAEPSERELQAFYKSLLSYLKQSFRNDLIQGYNRQKKLQLIDDYEDKRFDGSQQQRSVQVGAYDSGDIICLDDLLKIVNADVRRKERNAAVARDRLNFLFLKSVSIFYTQMFHEYGNVPIVRDINAVDARDFFIFDIREGRTEAIGKILGDLISQETIRAVVLSSKKLLSPESGYYALNRKISRYFNDMSGGMPARLKKAKEKPNDSLKAE